MTAEPTHLAILLRESADVVTKDFHKRGVRPPLLVDTPGGVLVFGTDPFDLREVRWGLEMTSLRRARPLGMLWNRSAAGLVISGRWQSYGWVWGSGTEASELAALTPIGERDPADLIDWREDGKSVRSVARHTASVLGVRRSRLLVPSLRSPIIGGAAITLMLHAAGLNDTASAFEMVQLAISEAMPEQRHRWWQRSPETPAWFAADPLQPQVD
ncbi:hypothetical protein D5S17_31175 [Pseudonocardiaceae bacterium YIM PH 21723]|nr:hypothetical protein D5S17_31175 [Pseudonocardiaceae bacterium YIM PH 21723]